jgi:dTDP-4-amino-4,6-dideoxygalactose transaminase
MTEVAAAIGRVQLAKLSALVDARRAHAARIRAPFSEALFQRAPVGGVANGQTLGMLVAEGRGSEERDRLIASLREHGVQAGPLSYALHRLPQLAEAAASARAVGRSLEQARAIAERGVSLPLFPSMSDAQVELVIAALRRALDG